MNRAASYKKENVSEQGVPNFILNIIFSINIHCSGQPHRDSVSNTSIATMINRPEGHHTQQSGKTFCRHSFFMFV